MPALVFVQTIRLRGLRPSLTAAGWTVGYPRQSMKVPKTPPSQRQGRTAAIQASLKARNSASVISPNAVANSRCLPPVRADWRGPPKPAIASKVYWGRETDVARADFLVERFEPEISLAVLPNTQSELPSRFTRQWPCPRQSGHSNPSGQRN